MIESAECQNILLKDLSHRTNWNDTISQTTRETMSRTPSSAQVDGADAEKHHVIGRGVSLSDEDEPFGCSGLFVQNCMDFADREGDEGDSDNVKPFAPAVRMDYSCAGNGVGLAGEKSNAKEEISDTTVGDMLQFCALKIQEEPFSMDNFSSTSDAFFHSHMSSEKENHEKGSFVVPQSAASFSQTAPNGSNTNSSGTVGSKKDDTVRSNLFVSGLHALVTDVELYTLFSSYGKIESAKVMLDIHTGKSRGIAFVKYEDVASAKNAVDALNSTSFLGETIAVRVAKPHAAYRPGAPTNRTFVRNVPLSLKKADLVAYFGAYGEVVDVSIHSDTALRLSDKRRSIAFITYTTKEAAARAAQETHTKMAFPECDGIPLLAKVAEDSVHRTERLARRGAPHKSSGSPASGPGPLASGPGPGPVPLASGPGPLASGPGPGPGPVPLASGPGPLASGPGPGPGPVPLASGPGPVPVPVSLASGPGLGPTPGFSFAPAPVPALYPAPLFFAPPPFLAKRETEVAGVQCREEASGTYQAVMPTAPTIMYYLPNGQVMVAAATSAAQEAPPLSVANTQVVKGRRNEGKRRGL